MPLLLDTHVWIWSQAAPERLGPATTKLLTDPSQGLHVSTVSTLELARLVSAGRIVLSCNLEEWVSASLDLLGCTTIDVSHAIAVGAYQLPGSFHRDPADRVLVATARSQDLLLVTADERIVGYPHVTTQDARR